jgi:hypothetical protein
MKMKSPTGHMSMYGNPVTIAGINSSAYKKVAISRNAAKNTRSASWQD